MNARAGTRKFSRLFRWFALFAVVVCLGATPAYSSSDHKASDAASFKVLAFYSGTFDAAHISFVKEANEWFPKTAEQNGFSYTSTNDWSQMNASNLAQYQVVLFLDDVPHSDDQRSAFQKYVEGGGGWMGFHVAAFSDNAQDWPWFHNTFLGSGTFKSNTWGPTKATLRVEDRTHPSTKQLPETFESSVSEWYSWNNNLRDNKDIKVLASVDKSSFPLGTDPNQTWYEGDYPIIWTNTNYKMLYANFGHNAMNYDTNTPLSSTFESETQNTFLIDGLKWLSGTSSAAPDTGFPSGSRHLAKQG